MGLKDLNIEFEDENEKEKSNKIDVGVELNFSASEEEKKAKAQAQGNVTSIGVNQDQPQSVRQAAPVADINTQVLKIQKEIIKEAEAEKREYLVSVISEGKLVDHKLNVLLTKLSKTAPQSKQELIMIKKLISDFLKLINDV
jgi:hypothetical protein